MDQEPQVGFIIVGAQKGGTTALFDYLADEPGVALSRVKEVHFFDDESQDWSRPDYAAYHGHFDAPDGRPCGEATPIYMYWPGSLERIAAYNRAVRVIVLLRDPVQRAWSHWRMEYARGAETEPFAWCVREGRRRLFDAEPWGHHREFSYVERGFYGEQMERLFGLFPREQVLVLKAEDLRADPGAILSQVRAFIGAPEGPPPRPRDVHVGREMAYPSTLTAEDVAFLRRLYARDMARLRELTGVDYA
ncbi:sulfotransferase domain-containing protein [Phenylobacterium sp.]|uniref:sulfotransferase domain-containing protein n=1 Tax=Phenylobacterium sp. TaxID=1871053 RepID=UPI002B830089|nr:sulfotransferase domain-containing protein [Phenylobacterium sp.]HVI32375.1 sulfotransferase domain-containing protein [Phenylobacterium sp.]